MALHNVSESDSFDTNVQMPTDGDGADASDFEASTIQPLTNRTRWLKTFVDALISAYTFAANTTWTIANSAELKIKAATSGTGKLNVKEIRQVEVANNVEGQLFFVGAINPWGLGKGRANRKPLEIAPGAGITNVDPIYYDTIYVNNSAACTIRLVPSVALGEGDWVHVIGLSASFTVTVQNDVGATLAYDGTSLRSSTGNHRSAVYVWTGGAWKAALREPYDP